MQRRRSQRAAVKQLGVLRMLLTFEEVPALAFGSTLSAIETGKRRVVTDNGCDHHEISNLLKVKKC